jgi:ABC-type multidrug transport system fused ATPase/permease subunit
MNIKKVIKSLSNIRWLAASIRPYLGALILIIAVESLAAIASVLMAVASKNLVDSAIYDGLKSAGPNIALFVSVILFMQISRAFLTVYTARVHERYSNDMRQGIFAKLINIEWAQVSRYHSGDLLTRLTSDINSVTNGSISVLPQIISLGVQLTAAFVTLMVYDKSLAILAFVLAPFTILVSRFYGRRLGKMHIQIQETESTYRSQMQEYLQNLLVIKTFNLEENSKKKIGELQKEKLELVTKRSKAGVMASTIMSIGYWLGYGSAFGWGIVKVARGTATYGTMTAFLQLVNQVQAPFMGLSRMLPQIIAALASAGRLIELERLNTEVTDELLETPGSVGIKFENVSFSYEDDEVVLNNISMEALPGEIVAIIGSSGEGKTTIIRLMLALLKPDAGSIYCFNERDEKSEITCATRSWFSYVPQGNTLLSGTIADNLRTGEQEASESEMKEALKAACALEFVEKLPDGINTVIGEKAYGLSEGQAQRIAIARAYLRKAPIIILDEATSALDIELEEKVLQSIQGIGNARTCIMITHRMTALNSCSKVFRLREGFLEQERENRKLLTV